MDSKIKPGDWIKFKGIHVIAKVATVDKDRFSIAREDGLETIPLYLLSDIERLTDNRLSKPALKTLVKKFSYNGLMDLCAKKGWRIPSSEDVKDESLEYETIWLSDEPEKNDIETHAFVLDDGVMKTANKKFMYNAVVVREGDAIVNALNKYLDTFKG